MSMRWNSGRLVIIIATVSPRPMPSAAQPGGELLDTRRVLAERDLEIAAWGSERDLLRARGGGQLEGFTERGGVERGGVVAGERRDC